MKNNDQQTPEHEKNDLTLWQYVWSVLAAFFGVQADSARERDFQKGNPVVFVVIGLVLTVLFVLTLVLIVGAILPES